ncbi:hypothetical protein [Streptomyces spectabilis]|uniref:Uncharacterized protein n=1 Tax=Streptomyces spectabilis TaxID=68270 RepID=A0A7W8ARM5_STRST|nr:hypothetical protein [Streptomyces spectabilis]MBB5103277.1 hypothetical protein [Streptomyces spectabilis]MCI3902468.1 hypothetical protein [Streptomyces spectabilis]GGV13678.1 hypothetical protein GCM10010245_23870 [Streptomyces spectabilis]
MSNDPIDHAHTHAASCPMILWPEGGTCNCGQIEQEGIADASADYRHDPLDTTAFDTID